MRTLTILFLCLLPLACDSAPALEKRVGCECDKAGRTGCYADYDTYCKDR